MYVLFASHGCAAAPDRCWRHLQVSPFVLDGRRGLLLASCSGESAVRVWFCALEGHSELLGQPGWSLVQSIDVGFKLQHCAALHPLPGLQGSLLLALGGVDGVLRLHLADSGSVGPFREVSRLEGHQDWVRCLAFQAGGLPLPSASTWRALSNRWIADLSFPLLPRSLSATTGPRGSTLPPHPRTEMSGSGP